MRNNKSNKGFTLIELLIVIAIIGILAAVLIPNLLGARTAAAQRAGQSHSANVYTSLNGMLASAPANANATTIVAIDGVNNCEEALEATAATYMFGWNEAPANVDCTVSANDDGTDFRVEVTVLGKTFVNGKEQE